jgi:hypothetical protein
MKYLPLLLLLLTPALSQDEVKPAAAPKVEKIDENTYRIGDVVLDKKTREIRFPGVVNLREGLLEYLIVHQNGKIHESLFRTETSPTNINVAFTLLRYKPSKELYRIPKEPGILSGDFYQETEETRLASRITIDVEVEKDGEIKRYPVNDWIRHETTAKAMPRTFWVYGGSDFYDGKFVPESTGDIAAIFVTNSSLINYPGEDNFDDEVWTSLTERIPALETKVTLVIAPFIEKP